MTNENLSVCGSFANGVAIGEYTKHSNDEDPYPQILYNTSGEVLISGATNSLNWLPKYGKDCFRYNLFPVEQRKGGKRIFGFINSEYKLVIPYKLSAAEPFKDEFTSITGKGCGLLDSYGNVVWLSEEESENLLKEER